MQDYNEEIPINLDEIDLPEPTPVIEKGAPKVKIIYPFAYYYHMAVVDYTRFENRETIRKPTYVFSGVSADRESADTIKEDEHLVERVVEVKIYGLC